MSSTAARIRRPIAGTLTAAMPGVASLLAAATVIRGLVIKAATGGLGTPLPPFLVAWGPAADPLAIVSVVVLGSAAVLTPRWLIRVRRPPAFAAGAYLLALALGLSLNVAHVGLRGWWSVFASGPRGSRESAYEYLPGLPALAHGIGFYVGHYAQLLPTLPLHVQGNPPGPLIALHLLRIETPGALAALCIGVGALTAPLAYDLGRVLGGEPRGRAAAVLTAFTPSLLLFGVTSVDYAFAALGLCAACLLARPRWTARLAGSLIVAVASMFSWLLLAIAGWAALLALKRDGPRRALEGALIATLAVIALNAILALATGYEPVATLRGTAAVYHHVSRARPYAYWLFGSPVAWGTMLGIPTAALALPALAHSDPAAIALAGVVVTAAILGFTKAETERIWLPFVPLACVAAASAVPIRRAAPIRWALTFQALAVELLFDTIW